MAQCSEFGIVGGVELESPGERALRAGERLDARVNEFIVPKPAVEGRRKQHPGPARCSWKDPLDWSEVVFIVRAGLVGVAGHHHATEGIRLACSMGWQRRRSENPARDSAPDGRVEDGKETSHAFAMKPPTSLLLSAAILLTNSGIANAADSKPQPVQGASQRHWELQIVDGILLKQDGTGSSATLRNVTDYLVELYPANVVLAPTLGDIEVGNLKLAGFKWESALEALRIASGNQFVWSVQASAPETDPATGLPSRPASRDETDLYVLEPDPAGARRAVGGVVEVFNLAGYLQGKEPAQVPEALKELELILAQSLDQVRASSGFAGSEPAPNIRFHERASLLVLVGTAEQVDVARKIILALPGTAPSQAGMGMGYGGGGMGGGAMGGGAAMGGGGFGRGGMDEAMMMRYGLRPRPVPQPGPGDTPKQPAPSSGGMGIGGPSPSSGPSPTGSPAVAPRAPGK